MDDNLHDLQTVLDGSTPDIAQVLPEINDWPDAVIYYLKSLEDKAVGIESTERTMSQS